MAPTMASLKSFSLQVGFDAGLCSFHVVSQYWSKTFIFPLRFGRTIGKNNSRPNKEVCSPSSNCLLFLGSFPVLWKASALPGTAGKRQKCIFDMQRLCLVFKECYPSRKVLSTLKSLNSFLFEYLGFCSHLLLGKRKHSVKKVK